VDRSPGDLLHESPRAQLPGHLLVLGVRAVAPVQGPAL
ncbi:MAG: hypothetical protein AVDCRST_MAG35-1519, partial [uncultured Quadrisphaera sp.]